MSWCMLTMSTMTRAFIREKLNTSMKKIKIIFAFFFWSYLMICQRRYEMKIMKIGDCQKFDKKYIRHLLFNCHFFSWFWVPENLISYIRSVTKHYSVESIQNGWPWKMSLIVKGRNHLLLRGKWISSLYEFCKKKYIIRQIDHCYPTHERSFLYKYKY